MTGHVEQVHGRVTFIEHEHVEDVAGQLVAWLVPPLEAGPLANRQGAGQQLNRPRAERPTQASRHSTQYG